MLSWFDNFYCHCGQDDEKKTVIGWDNPSIESVVATKGYSSGDGIHDPRPHDPVWQECNDLLDWIESAEEDHAKLKVVKSLRAQRALAPRPPQSDRPKFPQPKCHKDATSVEYTTCKSPKIVEETKIDIREIEFDLKSAEAMKRQADEEERRTEQKRLLESMRQEQEQKKMEELLRREQEQKEREKRDERQRRARSQSVEVRKRQREADATQHNDGNAKFKHKLLDDIEGDWLIQVKVEEEVAKSVLEAEAEDMVEERAVEAKVEEPAAENAVQNLTLPVASIKCGVLTWAARLNREGNFPIEVEQGGLVSYVDGQKKILGTLECPSSQNGSSSDPFSNNYKLRWNSGDNWVKASKS